jgi:hypothetical protein
VPQVDFREFVSISIMALIIFLFADVAKTFLFVSDLQATSSAEALNLLSPFLTKMMDGARFEFLAGIILLILLFMTEPPKKKEHQ